MSIARNILNRLASRIRPAGAEEEPIFLFCASWRTGSTLLQRIICASNVAFIWGEPRFLPQAAKLHDRMLHIQQQSAKSGRTLADVRPGSWMPVLFPGRDEVKESFRQLFRQLYFEPVRKRGYRRWGFKEVRPGAVQSAEFLYHLFPGARFLFLVRDPLDTYLSIKNKPFFSGFDDPMAPVKNWAGNSRAFLEAIEQQRLPAMLVRYEDLVASEESTRGTLKEMCAHLHIRLTPAMLREISFRVDPGSRETPLTEAEREEIISRTEETAARLGYELST